VTDYRKNGSAVGGGASLPTATAAGELLRSTAAGTTYEAVGQGDVVSEVLADFIGSDPAGTAIISDGAGDVGPTSAAVSGLLAAADAAGMRAAIFAPLTTPTFASAGWTYAGPAGAAASIVAGVLGVTIDAATSTPAPTYAAGMARTITGEFDASACDVRVRISAFSGTGSFLRLKVTLFNGTQFVQPQVIAADGTVRIDTDLGTGTGVVVAGILGGEGWLRLVVDGGLATVYGGIGTGGAEPTAWTFGGARQRTDGIAPMDTFRVEVQQADTSGGAVSVSYRDLSVRPL